ncbi:MAG: DgsA anti-repressor MtfA [Bacteroidetes bacterium]|nr:MAG: DgsA anti-repressor MtfA [Bacteroidota bacterium]
MEEPEGPYPLIVILTFIFFGASLVYYILVYLDAPFVKKNLKKYLFYRNLQRIYQPYLSRYFPFYNALSDRNKLKFERRVQKFIDMKQFISRGGIREITPEMKALVAGSAIQLTFGYPTIYFRHFWRILIYPDDYYSTITQKYHKGEVNLGGIIVLSWKNLKDGFRCHADGIHLGLHEMAHALRLINIVDNPEYDFFDRRIMQEFDREAKKEILKIRNGQNSTSIFREYSTTNKDEFFAVAVEIFFEQSKAFYRHNPRLYRLLSMILKIDPIQLARTGDPKVQRQKSMNSR